MNHTQVILMVGLTVLLCFNSCSQPQTGDQTEEHSQSTASMPDGEIEVPAIEERPDPNDQTPIVIPTISLGGNQQQTATQSSTNDDPTSSQRDRWQLLNKMKHVQVMLGTWQGTTQKNFGDFKALDEPVWVWDFQSDPQQPAMVMRSEESRYFKEARLTFNNAKDRFELSTVDPDGKRRSFTGTFRKPVEQFQGDDQKMHLRYQLELKQSDANSVRDTWQVTFNQQRNDRYLMELSRKSGANFIRFDTVATQRQGTSFGKSDADYGERECIISGGLGTSQVSYNGKSYWVCCSGCRDAFEDDPESWIAEYAEKKKSESIQP